MLRGQVAAQCAEQGGPAGQYSGADTEDAAVTGAGEQHVEHGAAHALPLPGVADEDAQLRDRGARGRARLARPTSRALSAP